MRTPSFQQGLLPKRYVWLSLAVMIALLVLSIVFWKERAWFLDVAFQTVLMIKDGTVQVQVYRFGAAIVQALPLAAIHLQLPLEWVSLLYSMSFNLIYLLFFLIVAFVFRQHTLAVALGLLYTLMTVDGFYWCTSELQQGLGFLLVVWAFVLRYPTLDRWWQWGLLVPSLVALIFYHPLVFIPFFFCWVYFAWTNNELRHRRYALLLILLFALLWAKSHWFANWYDTAKMETFQTNLEAHFPNYFSFPAYGQFLQNSALYWWGVPLLLLLLSAWYVKFQKWIPLTLIWGASLSFLVLNAIGSPDPSYRFYSEVNYYPLAIFVAVPFCHEVLPQLTKYRWAWWVLLIFFAARLLFITGHHQPYTDRLDWLEAKIATVQKAYSGDRFMLAEQHVPMDTLIMSWGTPFESLLMTAAKDIDNTTSLFITPQPERFPDSLRRQSELFLMEFFNIPVHQLQGTYFEFEPTGHYDFLEK